MFVSATYLNTNRLFVTRVIELQLRLTFFPFEYVTVHFLPEEL